jgi:4-amino-4-deoxy-L-arabinose transferase-like glycosyltransferase
MKVTGEEGWFLWQLWCVAFSARLAGVGLALLLFPDSLVPPDTANLYLPIARNLAAGRGFQYQESFQLATGATPVMPSWLALLAWGGGGDPPVWVLGCFHSAFRAGGVVLLYLLTRRYFGRPAARGAALLYMADPWEAFWAGFVLKEALAVPLFLLAVWLLARLRDRPSWEGVLAAGAVVGVATLARLPSIALWGVGSLLLLRVPVPGGTTRWGALGRRLGLCAGLTAGLVVGLLPWLLWTWIVLGQPVLSPYFAGQKFYTSNGPGVEMVGDGYYAPKGLDPDLMLRLYHDKKPWEREGQYLSLTLEHLVSHPGEAACRIAAKAVNMWQPTFPGSSPANWLVLGIPYCLFLAVCLAGVVLAVRGRKRCPALWLPLLVFFLIHLAFWGEIRNRQYLTPLLFGFGGLTLAWLFHSSGSDASAKRP